MFVMLCEVAGAVEYNSSSGIDNINTANCSYWSTVLSNNNSIVNATINVNSGALNLSNATIRMYSDKYIYVKSGATMNVTNGSTVTRYSDNYFFIYLSGSYGYLNNSTIEYSYQFQIDTKNNLKIDNTTIRNNRDMGVHLTSSSGNVNIINSKITNSATGTDSIFIESSGNNILRGNNINGTVRNLYVTENYSNDIDTSNRVNGGKVYYRYNSTDVSIEGDKVGHITLYNSSNVSILNNTLVADGDGIRLNNSINNVTIDNNTIYNSNYYGIDLTSSRANITNNNIITSDLTAISISSSDNSKITNNTVSGGGSTALGIQLSSSNNNNLINNTVIGSGYNGIELLSSNNNTLVSNILTYNSTQYGIKLSYSSSNNITNNTVKSKTLGGLYLSDSSNYNTIIYNNISYNTGGTGVGIEISSSYNNILNNIILSNPGGGITISSSHNNILNNTILSNSGGGITISSSHNNILNNTIFNNSDGVTISSGTNNSVSNNNISLNTLNGIQVGSYGNSFSDNILINNTKNGIYIQMDDNTFSNNTITKGAGAGYGFYIDFGQYDNYIYQNNTVNGEKIYYYFNNNTIQTVKVESLTATKVSNVGKISLIKCSNFEIKDNVLSNNTYFDGGVPSGIFLYNSTGNTISNNNITNNYRGLYLYNSSNNSINNLNSINTNEDRGIYFNISNYNDITNNILGSNANTGIYFDFSDHNTITNNILGLNTNSGIYFDFSDHNTITNNILGLNAITGIYFDFSDHNNITGNNITGSPEGIFFNTSLYNSLFTNNISNYTFCAIRLIEYSLNNTMIGNIRSNRNSAQFDIHINDSNNIIITNNQTTAANYTLYLTGDTRLVTLDTVFNKTKVGYEDTSNLTLMWRIDVLSWDNKHIEPIWGNLTVRYGDYSDVGGILLWSGQVSNANGRLSNNLLNYWGPPDSGDNWLPIIEYKQNATGKINYQSTPMNASVINMWDKLQSINKSYRNITKTIQYPGITIIVDAGYTPNGKCYYCHEDKLNFTTMVHWTKYSTNLTKMSNPYTPGRCIDCHDQNDSANVPHGTGSGKDMLVQQSSQLCYNGNGFQTCHNSSAVRANLNQKLQFNQTTHHQLGEGKMSCFSCHDNHGTYNRFDLHRYYQNVDIDFTYNSYDYTLCFVCHLEEKLKATTSSTGYLASFKNQTNFRDQYYGVVYPSVTKFGFNGSKKNLHYDHMTQTRQYTCFYCHSPHGSSSPAMTTGLNWTYITNLTPPGDIIYPNGNWANQIGLDQANWSNFTLNQAGGLGSGNKCGFHYLPSQFAYREFIDYEAAGGPGCVECHDSSRPGAIRKILNVSALKLAMHANLSWDFRNGGDLQGTGKNWTQWGVERGYNASNISTDNAICWSCHSTNGTPPYPGFHPERTLAPYTCPKCHGPIGGQPPHTEGLVAAIDNHGPTTKGSGSVYIQTNVGTNGSCENCHAPSRLPNSSIGTLTVWKSPDGNNPGNTSYTGRTTAGDVSHYGLTKSQGIARGIANPLFNTSNCLFCHTNSTKGAIWGNAMNISGNMYGADTSNLSECYTYCHVLPDYVGIVNENSITHFHNKSIYSGGGPNCVTCHDVNGTYHVQSLVNATSIAQGIHGNMGNNTIELIPDIDPRSKSCWGCHQSDGTEPEGMGDRNGIADPDKKPWTCEDCHTRSSEWVAATGDGELWLAASYPPNKLPPQVYNHFKNGTSISAYLTRTTDLDSCMGCHNNSEMFNFYLPDENRTNPYYTNYSKTSHYGSNRTDLVDKYDVSNSTEYCSYCHVNISTIFIEYENNKNIQHAGGFNCSSTGCHGPGRLHSETLTRPHTSGNCTDCHALYGKNKTKTVYEINVTAMNLGVHANLNSNMTSVAAASPINDANNAKCWGCHVQGGAYPENGHKDTFNNRAYLCYDCHNSTEKAYNNVSSAPAVYNHIKNGVNISARTTADTISESCGYGCHNLSSMKVAGFNAGGNASYRVNLSQASHYARNRTDIRISNDLSDCTWCHRNSTNEFLEIFRRKGAPNFTENIPHATSLESCILTDCHKRGRIHDINLTIPTWGWDEQLEGPGGWQSDSTCKGCHYKLNGSTVSKYYVNETMFNQAVHCNVNCTLCHIKIANQPSSLHPISEYYWKWCECCHSYQSDPLNSSDRHNITLDPFNYKLNVSGNMTSVVNITDCTFCHNATDYNRSVAKYPVNKCRYCHDYPERGNASEQSWY
jgi:parallel beta-helix repeat protein